MPDVAPVLSRLVLASLLVATAGCAWLKPGPTPILSADELYRLGETDLARRRFEDARGHFRTIVERHPNSTYAPQARFLVGRAFYLEGEFEPAIKEFQTFMAFYPRHQIADLAQYHLAMSHYDQVMAKGIEQDQSQAAKALEEFRKLVREYPESRYATDALAKIDICRGRLAQKEVWVASFYLTQGNAAAARQRLEAVLRAYPRTLVVPEALWLLAQVDLREGKGEEARRLWRRLEQEFAHTEFGRRATSRLRAQR